MTREALRHAAVAALLFSMLLMAVGANAAVSAPEQPRPGGVFTKNNIYGEPLSMDPMFALGAATIMVQMNIFDGLVRADSDRNTVVPDIAERWTHTPDGKTFTFYLRKGVLYHDGTEVTAADFKYQFERAAHPDNLSPHRARLAGVVGLPAFQEKRSREISGITVVDKYTLRISMEKPNILLPYLLAGTWASAVPRHVVERGEKEFGVRPVGSGPFVFESWVRGGEIVLRKNPHYWRKDQWGNRLPYVDKVVFRQVREIAVVEVELERGNIDSAYIFDSAYPKFRSHPNFRKHLVEGIEFYTTHIGFNFEIRGAPWQDKRVRQAINHAIDRKTIVDVVRQGCAYVATGPLPPGILGTASIRDGYEYNPEKARRLLAEAGYPNGFSAKILTTSHPHRVAGTEAVMGYLNAVGVRLQIEVLDPTAVRVRQQTGKFEWYYANSGGEGHPLTYLQRAFHSRYMGSGGNWTGYRNPQVDQLLDRAADARDVTTMSRLVREAEQVVFADAVWGFVSYNKGVLVNQPHVRGLRATAIDMDWPPLEEVWLAWIPKRH